MSEPVAWSVELSNGNSYDVANCRLEAENIAKGLLFNEGWTATVVPLYRSPTLTDAEREAVGAAIGWCDDSDVKTLATLRGLLERTK